MRFLCRSCGAELEVRRGAYIPSSCECGGELALATMTALSPLVLELLERQRGAPLIIASKRRE